MTSPVSSDVKRAPPGRVSVVIPVFEQPDELDLQLGAVVSQQLEIPFEVIVADNGSRDATPAVIRRWEKADPRIRGVDASARRGPAAARNIGVAAATGDVLAFCDADDLVAPGWLTALVAAVGDADIAAGALDLATLNDGGRTVAPEEYTSQFGFLLGGLGANLAIRTDAFQAAGGFDETLHAGEDLDLSWRIQLAGGRILAAPSAIVAKRERAGRAALRRQVMNYGSHDPALYRRFRDAGMGRNARLTIKTYAWLIVNAPRAALVPSRRDQYLRALFLRAGRIRGSVRYRVFYP